MEDADLQSLLADIESDLAERKSSSADGSKLRQAICAFANDLPNHCRPGVVFVGVDDAGRPTGLQITDELLRTLADMRSDGNILPPPTMAVEKRHLRGADLAVVIVEPSLAPPVRFKGQAWIRVGPRRALATAEEEKRLAERRRTKDLPFELQPIRSATIADLDLDLFRGVYLPGAVAPGVIERNERSVEVQLASLRFLAPGPEGTPTVLGILAVGRQPRDFIPCSYVQFLRIAGRELGGPIKDQKTADGPLVHLLRMTDELITAHIQVETNIASGPTESARPDYPVVAVQQIVRNAVLHRSYEGTNSPVRFYWFDDRIEILSPGGPFGLVNRANFGHPGITDYRNLHLGEVMRTLGYVQKFGFGIPLARQECAGNGSPSPRFEVEETHVLAILGRRT
jgi:ATP-dependent DNA helicase RecG